MVPEVISVLILVAVWAVIKPDKVAAAFVLNILKAPRLLTPKPVPFKFKGSVRAVTPFNSNVAVLLIVVDWELVPNASLLIICKVPAVTLVVPA